MELGWHFDNSSFAVTMLLQAAEGRRALRIRPCSARRRRRRHGVTNESARFSTVTKLSKTLDFEPGDLVLFRGRNAIHRVTPTEGGTTRLLVVFAYNAQPGVALSESALTTFYGRTA